MNQIYLTFGNLPLLQTDTTEINVNLKEVDGITQVDGANDINSLGLNPVPCLAIRLDYVSTIPCNGAGQAYITSKQLA